MAPFGVTKAAVGMVAIRMPECTLLHLCLQNFSVYEIL